MRRPSAAVVLLVALISGPGCGTSPAPELASPTGVAASVPQATAAAPGSVRAANVDSVVTVSLSNGCTGSATIQPVILEGGARSASASFTALIGACTITVTQEGTTFPTSPLPTTLFQGFNIHDFFGDGVPIQVQVTIEGVTSLPSPPPGCIIADATVGAPLNLEGDVVEGFRTAFTLRSGRATGGINVDAADANYVCLVEVAQCPPALSVPLGGAKVHVKGRLEMCTGVSARVVATEVKIKKLP